jgi:hypothetical protein
VSERGSEGRGEGEGGVRGGERERGEKRKREERSEESRIILYLCIKLERRPLWGTSPIPYCTSSIPYCISSIPYSPLDILKSLQKHTIHSHPMIHVIVGLKLSRIIYILGIN